MKKGGTRRGLTPRSRNRRFIYSVRPIRREASQLGYRLFSE